MPSLALNCPTAVSLTDPDDSTRQGEFDNKFRIPVGIGVEHHEIHEGDSYYARHAADGGFSIAFKVPSGTKRAHLFFRLDHEAEAALTIYRGRTWTTDTGTKLSVFNRDENSVKTSILQEDKSATPAFTANGLLLDPTGMAGGVALPTWTSYGDKKSPKTSHEVDEIILKNDSTYVLTVVTASGAMLEIDWYEHTDE